MKCSCQILCIFFMITIIQNTDSSSSHLCHPLQNLALLRLKSNFVIDAIASSGCELSYPKTDSWKKGTDCCSWHGVTCNADANHVIGLDLSCSQLQGTIQHSNHSLFSSHIAPNLQLLNFAGNDFQGSNISSLFGLITFAPSLTHLNLSWSNLGGTIPSQISHLSNLVSLDLSVNEGLTVKSDGDFKRMAQNLTHLRVLYLDWVDMSSLHAASFMNLSSLVSVSLSFCKLQSNISEWSYWSTFSYLRFLVLSDNSLSGELPESLGNLTRITHLDVSRNSLSRKLLQSLGKLTRLTHLDVSENDLSGELPESLGNLTQLIVLDVSLNQFIGSIPSSIGQLKHLPSLSMGSNNLTGLIPNAIFNLTRLKSLDLSSNHLQGPFPVSHSRSHSHPFPYLSYLSLSNNLINGTLPSWLFTLPSLTGILLDSNHLTGPLDEFVSRSLEYVQLDNNNFFGSIPISISNSKNLTILALHSNNFSGIFDLDMLSDKSELMQLSLSDNNLSVISTTHHTNITYVLPQLWFLFLSSCNIRVFPNFLRALENLQSLDLSNNQIRSPIPEWMFSIGKFSLVSLRLNQNFLTGSISELPWVKIKFIDVHSNLLQGSLPVQPFGTTYYSVSNNSFTGEIPSSICSNAAFLDTLDLSFNNFTGLIPQCLGEISSLSVLDLQQNNLRGAIPDTFAKANSLTSLNLNGNQIRGVMPRSLVHCEQLKVLDLNNNFIVDVFPKWLGTLPQLQVLILRSNQFHGLVNVSNFKANHSFPMLRILDISNNNFSGSLPTRLIKNLKGMMSSSQNDGDSLYMENDGASYHFSVKVTVKGVNIQLEKILCVFTTIDLSNNKFEGEIPKVVGKLSLLKGFNLSHNCLTGYIPPSIGDLVNLEWLDLSSNKLVGEIPKKLENLIFLAVLNLSHNYLHGSIPQGKQFNTFTVDSYKGNSGLCGFPLSKTCGNDKSNPSTPSSSLDKDSSDGKVEFNWRSSFMGYGCGMAFGIGLGYLVFSTGSPKWFVRIVEGRGNRRVKRSKKKIAKSRGQRRN